ncbi:SRPBCC family protein [Streptomyces sp. RS10V-4]|uniref:SRPBCC family protein n=1 Tax=Streptomyces rhizoryzae TaxID=2932493 RepID=UPI002005743A|nr:SRPBCC family protein [Streptomyces rhizoryzae]MCK7624794.1 SRPBCC family protein [Streptomyces rhizoryzae]
MSRRLRSVELDFAASAPLRLVFTAETAAPPAAVYAALADDVPGWAEWFTGVSQAAPVDGGRCRAVRLAGGTRFAETVLAAEPGARYAYRVDTTNAPVLRALLEEWRLTPAGGGTRVRWTFAADGPAAFRWLMPLARPALGRAFRDSVRALDRRLAGS